jgi:DDE domain
VDSKGNTLEFLLSPTRDAEAAKRFFLKALQSSTRSTSGACPMCEMETASSLLSSPLVQEPALRVINTDKNAAYPKAIADLKASGLLPQQVELRQVKYLNNLIELDHRAHQTIDQAGDGLLLVRGRMANTPRVSLPRFGRVPKAEIYSSKSGKGSAWQRFKKPIRENSKEEAVRLAQTSRKPITQIELAPFL